MFLLIVQSWRNYRTGPCMLSDSFVFLYPIRHLALHFKANCNQRDNAPLISILDGLIRCTVDRSGHELTRRRP